MEKKQYIYFVLPPVLWGVDMLTLAWAEYSFIPWLRIGAISLMFNPLLLIHQLYLFMVMALAALCQSPAVMGELACIAGLFVVIGLGKYVLYETFFMRLMVTLALVFLSGVFVSLVATGMVGGWTFLQFLSIIIVIYGITTYVM